MTLTTTLSHASSPCCSATESNRPTVLVFTSRDPVDYADSPVDYADSLVDYADSPMGYSDNPMGV
ncbi:MAG: hypothetical protein IKP91_11385 [Bacteroidaceae bacterium]|nr:hypothetical protein [Bacteroidaceae bacterium]